MNTHSILFHNNKNTMQMETTIDVTDLQSLQELQDKLRPLAKRYTVEKAKLKDMFISVDYNETLPDSNNHVSKDCTAPVHEDLRNAFERMNSVLRDLCEQGQDAVVKCTGFSINSRGDGAVLVGYRDLDSGKVLNLTSPHEKFEDNGTLDNCIEQCKTEILLYLFEGKRAP